MPTLSGSTRTKCLSASWNVSRWSEIGLTFGIAHLDYPHIRGAYGLSGMGALPTEVELPVQLTTTVEAHARAFLLLLPQLVITKDNINIRANRPIFSMKSPFAETLVETDRSCPQLGNWPRLAEAGGGKGAESQTLNIRTKRPRPEPPFGLEYRNCL